MDEINTAIEHIPIDAKHVDDTVKRHLVNQHLKNGFIVGGVVLSFGG